MINSFGKVLLTGSGTRLKLKITYSHDFDLANVEAYLKDRADFVRGNVVELIWEPELPPSYIHKELVELLEARFQAVVAGHPSKVDFREVQPSVEESLKFEHHQSGHDLADTSESCTNMPEGHNLLSSQILSGFHELSGVQGYCHQMAEVHFGTLRSGQRIESDKSVLLVGDANQGSEIISGGDIFVLGCLRGTAHAGAFEEKPQNVIVFALSLCPIQLRIGSIISRGDGLQLRKHVQAEIARLDDDQIVVEPYSSKGILSLLIRPKYTPQSPNI